MSLFRIQNSEFDYRKHDRHIVLIHMKNLFQEGSFIDNSITTGTYRYTWARWQNYFHKELLMKKLPIHFFVELLNKDYVINIGCPLCVRSTFLKELSDNYIIDYDMRDAILIGIQEDFSIDIGDVRMFQHISDKLLSDLIRRYSIQRRNIVKFDDILKKDYLEMLKKSKLRYDFTPMNKLNMDLLWFTLNNYIKG